MIITCLLLAVAIVAMATSLQVKWHPADGARSYIIHYTTPTGSGWHSKARGQIAIEGAAYEHTMSVEGTMGLISIATTVYGPYKVFVTARNSAGVSPMSDAAVIYYTGR